MSIAQRDVMTAPRLTRKLQISRASFHDCDPDEFLHSICTFASAVWQDVDLRHYTNHDTRHSEGIIDYFLGLDGLYQWSKYEKMLFGAAAMLHDIGMQFNVWMPQVEHAQYPRRKLSQEEVRKRHIEFGGDLIAGFINRKLTLTLPAPCRLDNAAHVTNLGRAASIAFAHSGDEYWNRLKDPSYRARDIEKNVYRPRLLAGTLRLCDELDGNYTRLRQEQQNRLAAWDITDETRRHWFSCLFVENTEVRILAGKSAIISIRWRAPSGMTSKDIGRIRILLSTMREARIADEIHKIDAFYKDCGEHEHLRAFSVDLPAQPIEFSFPYSQNQEFKLALRKAVQSRHTYRKRPARPRPQASGQRDGAAHARAQQQVAPPEPIEVSRAPLSKLLEDWFLGHRQSGHFELVSGEHTDTYLNCRALVSNQGLLRRVADHIFEAHKGCGIGTVLAVGTSAIPISINVAHRLGCSVSFTMYSDRQYNRNINEEYHPIELDPTVRGRETILIVDDIISGGRVVQRVLDILEKSRRTPKAVFHQAIFRLGKRDYVKDPRVAQYSYIIRIHNIYYALSASRCALCKADITLQTEVEMH